MAEMDELSTGSSGMSMCPPGRHHRHPLDKLSSKGLRGRMRSQVIDALRENTSDERGWLRHLRWRHSHPLRLEMDDRRTDDGSSDVLNQERREREPHYRTPVL